MSEVIYATGFPARPAQERLCLVQDSRGNKLELTKGARIGLLGTWLAVLTALVGILGTVWHFGETVSSSIYDAGVASAKREMTAAQEADNRHREAEEFRAMIQGNTLRIEDLTRRIEAMEETQLRAAGLPVPPPSPQNQIHHHPKQKDQLP